MATKKIIAICQSGGEFETENDGSLSYRGGDAHAIDIDDQMKFSDFKMEVAEMFNCSFGAMSIKYFLPGNRKTLITVSNDKDLERMIKFHGDSITADVYIVMEENGADDVSNMSDSRSSRTTLSEAVPPLELPLDVVDDTTQPNIPVGAPLDIDGTNHIDAHFNLPPEVLSVRPLSVVPYEKHAKAAEQWQDTITGVGQRFSTDSYHGYCLHYLTEQLIRDLKGQFSRDVKGIMIEDLYRAAFAPRPEEFHKITEGIKSLSLEAYNWIMQSEPQNWANSLFQGARYNHMKSNFGELFYSWASDADELPITQMVDVIRGEIMELIYFRRTDSDQWLTRLTPSMEEKLEKESLKVSALQVQLTTGSEFEVQGESTEVVDMDGWDCSCKGWQLTGLPCCHAIAVINCIGRSPYDYCSRYFSTESYRLTYAESVKPIPDTDWAMQNDYSEAVMTVTPPTRRPPGRPTTKKVGLQEAMKRQLQCSKCKGLGHNKATCKELLDHIKDQVHHILYMQATAFILVMRAMAAMVIEHFVNHGCAKLKETLMVERWYLDEIQWKCSSFGAPGSCNVGDVEMEGSQKKL
ncbi:exonuclease v, mitochondrial [Gossypium arboreum]|uniref:Exonuclease v, mitochondrial n=1 Tax=Gossypium arboreum TaxID=29729 RepID=A0A0B0N9P4_GOSAR|nr:exonuclease v, mitochondrial [Gossypium arboreum]